MKIVMTCLAALLSLSVAGSAQASYGGGSGGYSSTPRANAKKAVTPRAKKAKGEKLAKKRPKGGSTSGYAGGYGGSGGGY